PAALAADLRAFGRQRGATPFMVLFAAFAGLLSRYTGKDDLLLGAPVANRTHRATEGLIGLFVNTLVLRGDLRGAAGFGLLLARARAEVLAADASQDLPFEVLVEALAPSRDLASTPLFQVLLAFQDAPFAGFALPGLAATPIPVASGTAKFDLTLAFEAGAEGFAGLFEYDRDLFDGATVRRLAAHLATLLAAGLAEPERRVAELPLLSAAEREQLSAWGWSGPLAPAERCLHELGAAQAARTPDAVALVASGERLSYAELARRAGRLARRLRALGVGPEFVVGVCLPRSAELLVALWAVLEAGGAYLPLDPAYPPERLALLSEDARAAVLLTVSPSAGLLPGFPGRVLLLDAAERESERGRREEDDGRGPAVTPDNLAYLIYTSGSTGRPKAVAIAHRSAVALLVWAREAFADGELAGVLAATSIGFDLSVFELFVPLSRGGRVVLVDNALALTGLAEAHEVTLVNTVPSALAELLRLDAIPPSVRTVNLAGEPLPRRLVEELHARTGVRRVLDLYGPSEDTTYSTFAPAVAGEAGPPAIGRPLPGTRTHVLDAALEPLPAGLPGELHLGGAGLARGYLHRPDLTAERFLPDPFAGPDGAGGRLYRTGDRVRFRADGQLDYLGRLDHQVKIRGFRIELGEIEAALAACPGVREAAVLARAAGPGEGETRLVAYLATAPGVEVAELLAVLRSRLPEFMVPAHVVQLDALPLTPNGKVDRNALARIAPDASRQAVAAAGRVGEPPRGAVEREVARVWCEVLGLPAVGREESFFALGGHSLLATQVISRLRWAFQVEIALRDLFAAPTVAG
ncbi:MAG TPA: amino acid adenylation domain-containing protein, partial [Thermoanaerobaculia bacterium]|nr:amino acid adenylation domain-containing protein [Thermoanaerobaculia bacterium]